jgi:hypothetical protein
MARDHEVLKLKILTDIDAGVGQLRPAALFNDDGSPYSPGGGSVFEHLVEDAGRTRVFSDWNFQSSNTLVAVAEDQNGPAVEMTYSGEYFWADYGDNEARLRIDAADGSLHFGDGENAPDIELTRLSQRTLGIQGEGITKLYVRNNQSGSGVYLNSDYGSDIYTNALPDAATATLRFWSNNGDGNHPELIIANDGSLQWSNVTDAPDKLLAPTNTGLKLTGPATGTRFGVRASDGNGFAELFADVDQAWLTLMSGSGDPQNAVLELLTVDDNFGRVRVAADGIHFGDGIAIQDVLLKRDGPGTLGIHNLGGSELIQFGEWATDIGYVEIIGASGSVDLLAGTADHLLAINGNGGGLQMKSPDGTVYNLIPPNGGGAASWVAA